MGRAAPSVGTLLVYTGIASLIILSIAAFFLGITWHIGPFANLNLDTNPELKAVILRLGRYFMIFVFCTAILTWAVNRYFYKAVPENFAAIIEPGNGHRVISVGPRVWLMPILESMTLFDLRPRDLNFEHKAITHDKLEITFHVTLTWQPYVEDLQMVLDANIQQERKLRTLAEHQLTHEVSKKSLAEVQSNVRVLAFHLQRFVGEPESRLEGARKYGMYLQEAKITKIDLPAEIIELNKTEKLTELRKKYGPTQPGISAG